MSQDELSPAATSSVIAVVDAVCETGTNSVSADTTSGNSSGGSNSSSSSVVSLSASASLASNIAVSQTILSIVSKMNVARAESSVAAAHGNELTCRVGEVYGIVAV